MPDFDVVTELHLSPLFQLRCIGGAFSDFFLPQIDRLFFLPFSGIAARKCSPFCFFGWVSGRPFFFLLEALPWVCDNMVGVRFLLYCSCVTLMLLFDIV